MTNRESRSLARVGVAFVALSAAEALNVIWRIGGRVLQILVDMKVNLPPPAWFAVHAREELSVVVVAAVVLAIGVHRHQRAVLLLALLGGLELWITCAYGFALWLSVRNIHF